MAMTGVKCSEDVAKLYGQFSIIRKDKPCFDYLVFKIEGGKIVLDVAPENGASEANATDAEKQKANSINEPICYHFLKKHLLTEKNRYAFYYFTSPAGTKLGFISYNDDNSPTPMKMRYSGSVPAIKAAVSGVKPIEANDEDDLNYVNIMKDMKLM